MYKPNKENKKNRKKDKSKDKSNIDNKNLSEQSNNDNSIEKNYSIEPIIEEKVNNQLDFTVNSENIAQAFVYSIILGKPKCKRRGW